MTLKARLAAGEALLGTFQKTPSPIVTEVLALAGLDLVCLDAEHSPFDRLHVDACCMAARAGGLPVLVRPQTAAPEHILSALDCGATGVLLPHIRSVAEAEAAVRACHYGRGGRGYAGSSRAAGYGGRAIADHRAASAATTVVVAQIEDIEAVEVVDAIARVAGLDALFVGRIDLTVAMGLANPANPAVVRHVERICATGRAAGVPVGMFVGDLAEVPRWREAGATLFLLGSDHGFLLSGARELRRAAGF